MDKVLSLLENIGNYLLLIRISDILDIAIIAFLVYNLLRMVKSTRAENILKGVVAFLLVLWLVDILQLNAISYLMRNLVQVGILSIIVLFQPEFRQILEKSIRICGILRRQLHICRSPRAQAGQIKLRPLCMS